MGYVRLKVLLNRKFVSMRDVAEKCNVNLDRLYRSTSSYPYQYPNSDLTNEEKQRIYDTYFKDGNMTIEEVFKNDGDIGYEFDTVFKSEARRKHRY